MLGGSLVHSKCWMSHYSWPHSISQFLSFFFFYIKLPHSILSHGIHSSNCKANLFFTRGRLLFSKNSLYTRKWCVLRTVFLQQTDGMWSGPRWSISGCLFSEEAFHLPGFLYPLNSLMAIYNNPTHGSDHQI